MKIEQIAISNFRSHVSTTLTLAALTVIRGANAAGKSSIEQAIDYALTGRAEGTDERGAGAKEMVRIGEKKATIALTLSQPQRPERPARLLTCNLNGSGRTVAVTTPGDNAYAGGPAYIEGLQKNKAILSCLTNNRYFVNQTATDQKNLLADIILPAEFDWTDTQKEQAKIAGVDVDWSANTAEVIADAYGKAYAERTAVKRDRKNVIIPEGPVDMADSLADIDARLKERRGELAAAREARTTLTASYDGSSKQRETLTKSIAACQVRIDADSRRVTDLDKELLSAAKLKAHKEAAKNLVAAVDLDTKVTAVGTLANDKKRVIDTMMKMKEGTCPTCLQAITEESIAAVVGTLVAEHGELNAQHVRMLETRKSMGDPTAATKALQEHAAATEAMQSAKGRIGDDEKAKHAYQLELDQIPVSAPDTTEADGNITDLEQRITQGEKALRESQQHASLREQQAKAIERARELDTRVVALEAMVAYFGPGDGGILSDLLKQYGTEFTGAVNNTLEHWGYTCTLIMEPYHFAVSRLHDDKPGVGLDFNSLSKSERYRFSVAFQVAIAAWSDFRFVIVDEADIFDAAARGALFNALVDNEDLDQAIILTTDERTTVPAGDDLIFYLAQTDNSVIPTTTMRRLLPAQPVKE